MLIDGLRIKWLPYAQTALVDGDCKSYTIAAASVLAKVTRDRLMREFEQTYPGYGFANTKVIQLLNIWPLSILLALALFTAGVSGHSDPSNASSSCLIWQKMPGRNHCKRGALGRLAGTCRSTSSYSACREDNCLTNYLT